MAAKWCLLRRWGGKTVPRGTSAVRSSPLWVILCFRQKCYPYGMRSCIPTTSEDKCERLFLFWYFAQMYQQDPPRSRNRVDEIFFLIMWPRYQGMATYQAPTIGCKTCSTYKENQRTNQTVSAPFGDEKNQQDANIQRKSLEVMECKFREQKRAK